jgi:hypothetical protein
MNEEKDTIKEQLKKIPKTLRDYALAPSWSDTLSRIVAQFGIASDKIVDLENEVLFVLICLEPTDDLVENIKREIGLANDMSEKIVESINSSILSPVMNDIKKYWATISQGESPEIKPYASFEQTILRQAQAMRPVGEAPSNLPGARPIVPNQNIAAPIFGAQSAPTPPPVTPSVSNVSKQYPANNDPYRESAE